MFAGRLRTDQSPRLQLYITSRTPPAKRVRAGRRLQALAYSIGGHDRILNSHIVEQLLNRCALRIVSS